MPMNSTARLIGGSPAPRSLSKTIRIRRRTALAFMITTMPNDGSHASNALTTLLDITRLSGDEL